MGFFCGIAGILRVYPPGVTGPPLGTEINIVATMGGRKLRPEDVDARAFEAQLDSSRLLPPLDLLIRTSGEHRISNFFLWEVAYAELFFSEAMWPDFAREHLQEALDDYGRRERRFGTVPEAESAEEPGYSGLFPPQRGKG